MGKLFTHAGHGKTGSTFIQNTLLLSHDNLTQKSIYYPKNISVNDAMKGVVTAGNARHCFENLDQLESMFSTIPRSQRSVLLSSEYLFNHLPELILKERDEAPGRLNDLFRRYGFDEWNVLLFVRDPIPFAISAWLQSVKSHREVTPLEEFILGWPSTYPRRVRKFIEVCLSVPSISLSLFNYSWTKTSLIQQLQDWLNVSDEVLIPPPKGQVNRSLTNGEAYLITLLNQHGTLMKGHLGKILVEELPDISKGQFSIPMSIQKEFISKMEEDMLFVSSFLPEGQQYKVNWLPDTDSATSFNFTTAQLDIIINFLVKNSLPR